MGIFDLSVYFLTLHRNLIADDFCFTDLACDNVGLGGAPIILAAQATRNSGMGGAVSLYAKSALQIHMNPIQPHYAFVELGTFMTTATKTKHEHKHHPSYLHD